METTKIETFDKSDKSYIKFTFSGRLEPSDAENAIRNWKKIFSENPDNKYIIIWDCLYMTGYDHDARVKWQSALSEMKNQIDYIWIITQSKIFKMGASVMALLTDIKLKVVASENKIVY